MARGYMSRLIAASVSHHTAPMPEPTKADFFAKVYDQAWQADSGTVTRFSVLALSPAHAERLGRIRISEQAGPVAAATVRLRENVCWDFDAERVVNILHYETKAEWCDRQDTFRRGEAA